MTQIQNRRRVLVVEDEILIAITIETALNDAGYDVLGPFAHVEQAVDAARGELLDAAVLDVNLGGSKAFPIADALAAAHVPFLFLTGYANMELPPEYRNCTILPTPFRDDAMVRAVGRLCASEALGEVVQ